MNYNERIVEIRKLVKEKTFDEAEEKLLKLIEESTSKVVEDEEYTYFSFNSYIEAVLCWNTKRHDKKNQLPDINYGEVYYYLGYINAEKKNYGVAEKYLKKGLERNPVDISAMFELAAVYRMMGNLDRARAHIEKLQPYLWNPVQMSRFYRELGWYYSERKVFDVANALYSYSMIFNKTELAENELKYIAKQENREYKMSSREEVMALLEEYNIPGGFFKTTIDIFYNDYKHLLEKNPESPNIKTLKQVLYGMTLDKQFLDEGEKEEKANTDTTKSGEKNNESKVEEMKKLEKELEEKFDKFMEENAGKVKVQCPVCNEVFECKVQVPDTQKTFDCNCTKCGAEIKKENPNYTGW